MTRPGWFLLVAGLTLGAASAHAQTVQIEFRDGRVSLATQNATPRQILAEWAKVGGTRIINGDRVPGTPMTIQLTSVSERQALDVVLRTASGYMAAPRTSGAGASTLDRVHILPTSSAPTRQAAAPAAATATRAFPAFQQVPAIDDALDDDEADADDDAQVGRTIAPPNQRGAVPNPAAPRPGVFPTQPGQQPFQPPSPTGPPDDEDEQDEDVAPAPAPAPGNPFGVAPGSNRPGVITQPPPARVGTPGQVRP